MKLLYVIDNISNIQTGGSVINQRNLDLFSDLFGDDNCLVYSFNYSTPNLFFKFLDRFRGFNGGLDSLIISQIIQFIRNNNVDILYLTSSLLGRLAYEVKNEFPKIKIITFFHNVEYIYIKDRIKVDNLNMSFLQPHFVKMAEKLSVVYSDYIICLNSRDSSMLLSVYGRSADLLLPTSFKEPQDLSLFRERADSQFTILFVGSAFFANIQGVKWFSKNVMPSLSNVRLILVGKGLEILKKELSTARNIEVIGTVEDLSIYYDVSDIVIMPIFLGSGMKTKTAEAMMYGKPIIGTPEAFEGYIDVEKYNIGRICRNANDFISSINEFKDDGSLIDVCSLNARSLFKSNYSYSSSLEILKLFLQKNALQ